MTSPAKSASPATPMRQLTPAQSKTPVGGAVMTVGPANVPVKVTFLQRN